MQRLKNLARFGLWFVGLGYIVSVLVGYSEVLPPWPALVGELMAVATLVQLLLIGVRQSRGRNDGPRPKIRCRRPEPTVTRVKARDHFGLRGVEH